ncbi:MAG: TRAP transporter small permease subunit [Alphaproteobacteria bacterium]
MLSAVRAYVRWVEAVNRVVGIFAMYLVFVMMAVLVYSSVTKALFSQPHWYLEVAQFLMVAYFLLGGGYSMQTDSHVRMDLFYCRWSPRTKAWVDVVTVFFLVFYLIFLLWGGYLSTEYSIAYNETTRSLWNPPLWPIKVIMMAGIVLMLLQTIATFFRDVASLRGIAL